MPSPDLLNQICYAINAGLLTIDAEERVVLWNSWLERHSDLTENAIAGQLFTEVFPDLAGGRVHRAIKAALCQGLSSLISQSLNRRPFPLYVETNRFDRHPMHQAISVVSLNCEEQRYCLVQIHDVTAAVDREQQLQRIAEELERYSYQDSLTGIANRRAFDQQYSVEFRRAIREGRPLALAIADVDYFKDYNDYYGHPAGDECLKRIAARLRLTLQRPGDMAARYGGEEFAILMPHTDPPGAATLSNTLCREILAEAIPHQTSAVHSCISISIGVVSLIPRHGTAPELLLTLADMALYRAKQAGRNQVCLIDETEAWALAGLDVSTPPQPNAMKALK